MFKNYLKIAIRNLARNKVYSFINIGGLALSMACGIIIFVLVKHHLSFDDFHNDSNRIYRIVTEMHRDNIGYNSSVPAPLGKVFREDYTFGEKVARIGIFTDQLITIKDKSEIKKIKEAEGLAFTEPEYFDIFNYPLIQGNKKTALIQPNTAIITERIAKKYFGNENPMGKEFFLDNKIAFTVTGILKDLPENTDIKTEIYVSYPTLKSFNPWLGSDDSWGGINDGMHCFMLLRPNVSIAEVEAVMPAYVKKHRPTSKNVHHYKLQPLKEIHFDVRYGGAMGKKNLWVLSLIGLFLIITACVNFINLATAQALKRVKEVGLRKVLGGVKSQLFWQFIGETAMLTLFGAVVAMVLAVGTLPKINHLFAIQVSINLFTDKYLAGFLFLLTVAITFLAGAYPGLVLAGFQPVTALKGKLSQQNIGGFNTRRTLIVAQFAITQTLIIGVVVIMSQMRYAKHSDLGFDKEAVVMIAIGLDSTGTVMNSLKTQFLQIAGVDKVSLCIAAPASMNNWNNSIRFDNQTEEVNFRTNMKAADEDYISTFGLELVAGKNISPSDSVREFLVNEALTRKLNFQSPEEAIGKMIAADGGSLVAPIVGIVKDFHERSFHEEIGAVAIMTHKENYSNYAIKINLKNAKSILESIENAWTARHPDQIFEYQFLDESIAKFYKTEETLFKQIQILSLIAIFIGCLGLYGLVSFMANQKTKEIGIRKVLGGSIAHILWIFGKEFSFLILIAFFIAAPIGWWVMNQWLQDFKYRIEIGASIFVLSITVTFLIALITVSWQSIKAALMNPVKSLRSE